MCGKPRPLKILEVQVSNRTPETKRITSVSRVGVEKEGMTQGGGARVYKRESDNPRKKGKSSAREREIERLEIRRGMEGSREQKRQKKKARE